MNSSFDPRTISMPSMPVCETRLTGARSCARSRARGQAQSVGVHGNVRVHHHGLEHDALCRTAAVDLVLEAVVEERHRPLRPVAMRGPDPERGTAEMSSSKKPPIEMKSDHQHETLTRVAQ
jgi:hypothetical protein